MALRACVLVAAVFPSIGTGPATAAEWIWTPGERTAGMQVRMFTTFELNERPTRATMRGVADFCEAVVLVNGKRVVGRSAYGAPFTVDFTDTLVRGTNEIAVECRATGGPAAVFLAMATRDADGRERTIATDATWRSRSGDATSQPVSVYGTVARSPWGAPTATDIQSDDDYTQWKRAIGTEATDPSTFDVPDGFTVERLHAATEEEGSWVAMTFDPKGRPIVARESKGLLRFTVDERSGRVGRVETIDESLAECRGLAFADGDLFAMANNDKGLFRLRDTDGDDRFDDVRRLATFEGDVGHGRNQITIGPDGALYAIFGDSVHEPPGVASRVPPLGRPSRAERTRSGFVARMDRSTGEWEVLVRGLRNPFGLAFDDHGELFTYDADAEYDMGSPWYRPTRIVQLVPGGDVGWRRVTRQWPPYLPDRPDTPQPTLDIGKGSPTAVAWGGASNFPPPYRSSMFALDWAYGRILAVHLEPRGSGYAARAETFLRGRPANVTDVEFGPDGAMYFVTGGRGTKSALYRVRWTGAAEAPPTPTAQQRAREEYATTARARRRSLESLHGPGRGDEVPRIWRDLADPDPWIAHAARVALEWQPVDRWIDPVREESDPTRALAALLALVRVDSGERTEAIAARLAEIASEPLDARQTMVAVFVAERLVDEQPPSDEVRATLLTTFDRLYPHTSFEVNQRIGPLLKRLEAGRLVDRTIPLLRAAETQREQLQHLLLLHDVTEGWTDDSRRTYFAALRESEQYTGGEGMPTFRKLLRDGAIGGLPEAVREDYETLLGSATVEDWREAVPSEPRPFVRKWTVADLASDVDDLGDRNADRGRRMFEVARCIVCHRVEDRGGVVGPDLTSVARRFGPRDVLTSIVEPSRVIDEKYRLETFVLDDGRTVTGRPLPGGDFRSPQLRVATDALDPGKVVEFEKAAIEVRKVSDTSPMPSDLLNGLTRDEVLDLLAWLDSVRAKNP